MAPNRAELTGRIQSRNSPPERVENLALFVANRTAIGIEQCRDAKHRVVRRLVQTGERVRRTVESEILSLVHKLVPLLDRFQQLVFGNFDNLGKLLESVR